MESPQWGDSNKYRKHMFYVEITIKQDLSYISISVQQQIYFNGNVFGNKCCRCNEGSLYNFGGGSSVKIVSIALLNSFITDTSTVSSLNGLT